MNEYINVFTHGSQSFLLLVVKSLLLKWVPIYLLVRAERFKEAAQASVHLLEFIVSLT